MGKIKGQLEYQKFKDGKPLTWKGAVLAQCYMCNGEEEGTEDCRGFNCPLYTFFPYKGKRVRLDRENQSLGLESGIFMSAKDKETVGTGAI
jgi:hypothetical protein